jgi:uncharacterized YccA/Bax inhibitor family protein
MPNPALNENTFRNVTPGYIDAANRMTMSGVVNKTGLLLLLTAATSVYTWHLFLAAHSFQAVSALMMLGLFGGLILSMITIFVPKASPITAPFYALAEGLALGGISAFFETRFPGIAMQAVALTIGVLLALLMLYSSRILRVTDRFRMGVFAATGGIALFYFVSMLLSLFHVRLFHIAFSSPLSIGISLFVVIIAALNLVLDFDFIERAANYGAPRYMEWYGAFSIMVTLIWLYLEILRLLAKLNDRR